jgi:hypothetical protein
MWRRAIVICLLLLLICVLLYGERPYFGLESDFFFTIGDWAEETDFTQCFKVSVKKDFIKQIGGELSLGYLSFSRTFSEDANLSMFPVLYFDIYAEQQIGKSVFFTGIFVGPNYANQKVSYAEGVETGSVYGWSIGGYVILRTDFIVGPLVRLRYIKRADTDGVEIGIGVSL